MTGYIVNWEYFNKRTDKNHIKAYTREGEYSQHCYSPSILAQRALHKHINASLWRNLDEIVREKHNMWNDYGRVCKKKKNKKNAYEFNIRICISLSTHYLTVTSLQIELKKSSSNGATMAINHYG